MANTNGDVQVQKAGGYPWQNWLRVFVLWAAAIIGCLGFSSYVIVRWVERQVLTTDNWVAMVSPLPKQPVVATALGSYLSDQVFQAAPVEQKISAALPPQAAFLAAPLSSQLHTLTTKAAQGLVASDAFQTVWTGANRAAMNRVLATARGTTPPLQQKLSERFNLNLSDTRGKLSAALGKAADAFPALQPASQKALQVSADLHARPRRIHQVVRLADFLNATLPLISLAGFLLAIALAWRRRLVVLVSAVAIFMLMLVELIGLKWLGQLVTAQVRNAANTSAVDYIFNTLASGLKAAIYIAMAIAAVVWIIALLAGPPRWAVAFRSLLPLERLRASRPAVWWHAARTWVNHYKYYLWLAAAVLVLVGVALAHNVTGRILTNAALLVLALCSLIYIIGSPRPRRSVRVPQQPQPASVTGVTAHA